MSHVNEKLFVRKTNENVTGKSSFHVHTLVITLKNITHILRKRTLRWLPNSFISEIMRYRFNSKDS